MIQRFFIWILEDYINQLVDKRIEEGVIEKLRQQQEHERKHRIAKLRASLNHKTSTVEKNTKDELQPSSGVHTRSEEPTLQIKTDQAAIKKQQELAAMKAKLLGKKK